MPVPDPISSDGAKKRRQRNIAIALGVVAFAMLVYGVTILKLSANVAGGG